MGKPTGFLEHKRETARVLPPKVRIANFNEFRTPLSKKNRKHRGRAAWPAAYLSASQV